MKQITAKDLEKNKSWGEVNIKDVREVNEVAMDKITFLTR
jgi:hypothetical protein